MKIDRLYAEAHYKDLYGPWIQDIMEECFGPDDYNEDSFWEDDQAIRLVALGPKTNDVLGFIYAGAAEKEDIARIYYIAVKKQHRGQGYASLLMRNTLNLLKKEQGYKHVLVDAWTSKKGTHLGRILDNQGFTKLRTKENAYEGMNCIECGGLCKCSAVIYYKGLE